MKCKECKKELISFKGHYLHPDTKCGGIEDGIRLDMEIVDEGLNEKWKETYGKPEKDDYDVRIEQEQELKELNEGMNLRQDRINHLVANLKTTENSLDEIKLEKLKIEAKIEGNCLLRRLWKWLK